MIRIISLLISSIYTFALSAQGILQVSNGLTIKTSNNVSIVLRDMSLIHNGILVQGTGDGSLKFTGDMDVNLAGSGTMTLNRLLLAKGAASVLLLQNDIGIISELEFTGGLLNLGSKTVDLGNSGVLSGESESSRAFTAGNGYIQTTRNVNAPSGINAGNLGAIISSSMDLGSTVIRRGHALQTNVTGTSGSLLRYYDILPSNNANLNASLRFQYFDAELNGLDESLFNLYRSVNNTTWTNAGFDARSASGNYVEKSGIDAFSRWTLASSSVVLPVNYILFNASCAGNDVGLTWETAQEFNTKNYAVEQSVDGQTWQAVAVMPAAGTGISGHRYSFVDKSPGSANNFYRIVAYDINNRKTISSVITSGCGVKEDLKVWPNPVYNAATVSIRSARSVQAKLTLYDAKGSLLQLQQTSLLSGTNQLRVNMSGLPQGSYSLHVSWGATSRIIKLHKL